MPISARPDDLQSRVTVRYVVTEDGSGDHALIHLDGAHIGTAPLAVLGKVQAHCDPLLFVPYNDPLGNSIAVRYDPRMSQPYQIASVKDGAGLPTGEYEVVLGNAAWSTSGFVREVIETDLALIADGFTLPEDHVDHLKVEEWRRQIAGEIVGRGEPARLYDPEILPSRLDYGLTQNGLSKLPGRFRIPFQQNRDKPLQALHAIAKAYGAKPRAQAGEAKTVVTPNQGKATTMVHTLLKRCHDSIDWPDQRAFIDARGTLQAITQAAREEWTWHGRDGKGVPTALKIDVLHFLRYASIHSLDQDVRKEAAIAFNAMKDGLNKALGEVTITGREMSGRLQESHRETATPSAGGAPVR